MRPASGALLAAGVVAVFAMMGASVAVAAIMRAPVAVAMSRAVRRTMAMMRIASLRTRDQEKRQSNRCGSNKSFHSNCYGTSVARGRIAFTKRATVERAISVYDEQRHNIHIALYSQDPGVICLIRLAHLLWFVGYPRQAQQKCEEALALARKFAHPFSLGYALNYALLICNDL